MNYRVFSLDNDAVMQEIYLRGPVVATFAGESNQIFFLY
jgi:hypothetical protein